MRKVKSVLLTVAIIVASVGSANAATKPVVPVSKNPILNKSAVTGLSITKATVENNVDPITKKDLPDFLLLSISNKSAIVANGMEIFYSMTDKVSKTTESYYQSLKGLSIKPGGVGYVYFDNGKGAGHFPENNFSLLHSSMNEVKFSIMISAKGLKIANATSLKSKGTGEKAGA